MYVRFVISGLDDTSGRRQGVFHAAHDLCDANTLSDYELAELRELLCWFGGGRLKVPSRFSRRRHSGAKGVAICWFKDTATEYVSRMHDICRILREHGIQTDMIVCERPGYIVYADEHQVAAEPFAETVT